MSAGERRTRLDEILLSESPTQDLQVELNLSGIGRDVQRFQVDIIAREAAVNAVAAEMMVQRADGGFVARSTAICHAGRCSARFDLGIGDYVASVAMGEIATGKIGSTRRSFTVP